MSIKNFILNSIFRNSLKQESEMVIAKKVGEMTFNRFVSEEDIRTEAYYLWEKAGKEGNSEDFWLQAEDKIRNYIEQNG